MIFLLVPSRYSRDVQNMRYSTKTKLLRMCPEGLLLLKCEIQERAAEKLVPQINNYNIINDVM